MNFHWELRKGRLRRNLDWLRILAIRRHELVNEIQLKYYEQHGLTLSAPEKTALQKVKPSPVQRPLDSYTDADREKIGFWQDVVDQWMLYRSQTGKPLSEDDLDGDRHMFGYRTVGIADVYANKLAGIYMHNAAEAGG